MDSFDIDLDSECVWLDDAWLNREDLVRRIKTMMDANDYQIARPSQALEALTKSLSQARVLALRITPEMSDSLNAAAQQTGRPAGSLAREAIANWLASAPAQSAAAPPAATQPSAAAAVVAAAEAIAKPGVTTEPASDEEAATAVALTPKRREGEGPEVEKRWFDK